MAFSLLIDEDFTLFVEEDNEDETDTPTDIDIPTETVHVKTEPESEDDTEYEFDSNIHIKEELDFENHFFHVDQYVDINNIKTEMQDEFETNQISSEEVSSNDEEPQIDITENIPKPPVLEISDVRTENVPDTPSNVTLPIQSDKENVSETPIKSTDSSETLCQKEIPVNTQPLDRRKSTDDKKKEKSELKNNKDNNKKLSPNKKSPTKAKKAASNKCPDNWKKMESRQFQNRNNNKALPYKKFPRDQKHARFEPPPNKNKQLLPYKQLNRPNYFASGNNTSPIGAQRQMRGTNQFFPSFSSNNNSFLANPQRKLDWTNPLLRNCPPPRFDGPQNLSSFNQTYCTILNAINQALGQQGNQHFRNGDDGYRSAHQRRRRPQWQNHNVVPARPPVWANSLPHQEPERMQPFPQLEPEPVLNSTRLQTYSAILQAVTGLNGGAITHNVQNWSVNSNNFRFQMSLQGRFSQFANF